MSISKQRTVYVSIRIDEKLSHLSCTSFEAETCIFKVHNQLRKVNEEAYEPVMVAIGPYHRGCGKAYLQEMEKHKLRYLQQVLKRREETSVERYVKAMIELEERARKYYGETISLSPDDFVEMMVLDGCFIVELFRKYRMTALRDGNEPIFGYQTVFGLARDLILLENQLPFFILVQFFNMTKFPSPQDNLIDMAIHFVRGIVPNKNLKAHNEIPVDKIQHLLGLVHDSLCFSFANTCRNVKDKAESFELTNSATELQEAGVQFKKGERGNLFHIKFIKGVLEIPPLDISEYTESPLRNLIAYEQYFPNNQPKYVCDYTIFLDGLINSPKDVELLRRSGIMTDDIGDDVMVYSRLNESTRFIVTSNEKDFSYSNICKSVNEYCRRRRNIWEHCRRRRNIWMAILRRNYFNSPWALLSFLAAVVLLLLTMIQTVFSGLSIPHK